MKQPPYTTQQVAEILGVTVTSVINWVKVGRLEAFRTPGGHRRITRESLTRFGLEFDYPVPPLEGEPDRPEQLRVLVVDAERAFGEMVAEFLSLEEPCTVRVADGAVEAAYLAGNFEPDIVLLDLTVPGMEPIEFVAVLRKHRPMVRIACMTGFLDERTENLGKKVGADRIFEKPIKLEELLQGVRALSN